MNVRMNNPARVAELAGVAVAAAVAVGHWRADLVAQPHGWHALALFVVLATPTLVVRHMPAGRVPSAALGALWVAALGRLAWPLSLFELQWPGRPAAAGFLAVAALFGAAAARRSFADQPRAVARTKHAWGFSAAFAGWATGALVLFESQDPSCAGTFDVTATGVVTHGGPCVADVITRGEATLAVVFCMAALLIVAATAAPVENGRLRLAIEVPWLGMAQVAVVAVSLLLLSSLGGAGIVVPLGLPLYLWLAFRAGTSTRAVAWTVLPALGVFELAWMLTYGAVGEQRPTIIALPLAAWGATQVMLVYVVLRRRRNADAGRPVVA